VRRWPLFALVLVGITFPAGASADFRAQVVDLQPLSGASPFEPGGCGVPGQPSFGAAAEPSIAVNPRDPDNLVAVWQQDRFAVDGGALSNVVAASRDGGRTWRRALVPGISRCTGGADERTSDPWVSIGPDGVAYLASLTFTDYPLLAAAGLAGPTNQLVSRSLDGGVSWSKPTTVVANGAYNDREAITADPRRPKTAYEVWVDRLGAFGETGLNEFVTTHDGGQTFSAARTTYTALPTNLPDPTLIEPLPDGALLDVFMLANASAVLGPPIPFKVMAMRSADGGQSWSTPVTIASVAPATPYDSATNTQLRAFPVVDAATAPDGSVYVVFNDIGSANRASILISQSTDSGRSWSPPRVVRAIAAQAFLPSVAVDADGTVGVLWDDFRNHRPDDRELTTDVWFASSTDHGHTFHEIHVAGPFNSANASETSSTNVAGRFLGDYLGLAARPSGFAAVFAQAGAIPDTSNIFFAGIQNATRGLRLSVTPRSTIVDRLTRFHFLVLDPGGHPLAGIMIRFDGRRARTNRRGRATISVRLRRAGRYHATAAHRGLSSSSVTLTVRPR
jgi:hypothetical protein